MIQITDFKSRLQIFINRQTEFVKKILYDRCFSLNNIIGLCLGN